MTFKSHKQPLCRACGKPIKKATENVWLYTKEPNYHHHGKVVVSDPLPANKTEAQKLVNQKIVSVRRGLDNKVIDFVSTWDGESYVDEFFCNRTVCAVGYAYMVVQISGNDLQSVAYADALYLQQNGKPRK